MPYETLLLERSGAYAVVTLNRPKVMNALNRALFAELDDVFTSLAEDAAVHAIILTGAGRKPSPRVPTSTRWRNSRLSKDSRWRSAGRPFFARLKPAANL